MSTHSLPAFRLGALRAHTTGSEIHEAFDQETQRPVLLKFAAGAGNAHALRREHELMRSLALPGVARPQALLDAPDGLPLMLLDPFEGISLEAALSAAPVPWRAALALMRAVAQLLAQLHAARIVHGDLRPANLLADTAGREVLLVDLHTPATGAAPDWSDPGSAAYLAPEQTGRLQLAVDRRADLYALGVMLYRLLAGRLPFEAADALEWIHCHLALVPRPPAELAPVPRGVSNIAIKLLAKSPDDRYQTAAGLLFDIDGCLDGRDEDADRFTVGTRDVYDQLRIPRTLFGRSAERAALRDAFARARGGGGPGFVLISGEAGSGKSSLVQDLRPAVAAEGGLFAAGKFDRYRRDVPYEAFAQAFTEAVRQMLSETATGVAAWRARLMHRLGANAQLMVQLVPSLTWLLGEQPQVPPLAPREHEARFRLVFAQFVSACASADRPLVLFFDDLQWADAASLDLLRGLIQLGGARDLLIVGACREEALFEAHPLQAVVKAARQAQRLTEIALGPLPDAELSAWLAEAMGAGADEAAPLATAIGERTGGNPFFCAQFLLELADEGALAFDASSGRWLWDQAATAAKGYTRNVAELLIGKLERLPPVTREALQQAACFGAIVEERLLDAALGRTARETTLALAPACEAGLLLRADGYYRWVHDRVQEAAYTMIPDEQRAQLRLRTGRLLVRGLDETAREERIFDVVSALNEGAALITDPVERDQLRRLNVRAGAKAKAAVDAAAAHRYFSRAFSLLPPDAWQVSQGECFALHAELAECAYLIGALPEVQPLLDAMLAHAASDADRVRAHGIHLALLIGTGRAGEAAAAALDALRGLGLAFPEDPSAIEREVRDLVEQLDAVLAGRPPAVLLDAPACDNPGVQALMSLLIDSLSALFVARPTLWPVVCVHLVRLSLQHGHTSASGFGYQLLAHLLLIPRGHTERVGQLTDLAAAMDERFGGRLRPILLFHGATYLQHWRRPYADCRAMLTRSASESLDRGDVWIGGNGMLFELVMAFEQGERLDTFVASARRVEDFARRPQLTMLGWSVRLFMQTARCLQGLTHGPASLEDDGFSEAELAQALARRGTFTAALMWHVLRQMVCFLAGRFKEAIDEARQAAALLIPSETRPYVASHRLFFLLARAALHDAADPAEQAATRLALHEAATEFEGWARQCADNHAARHALLMAELARIEGRGADAARAYEEALAAARRFGNTQIEVLAGERAACHCAAQGLVVAAAAYFQRACEACTRWGADGLLREMHARYPQLAALLPRSPSPGADALAIAKASQAVIAPMALERLPEALMRIAMQAAGAQRGLLLVAEGNVLTPAAQASVNEEGIAVGPCTAAAPDAQPWSVLNYVARTREAVQLPDATLSPMFASDPCLARRQPKSLLCLPLVRGAELIGVLYVEHVLVAEAFAPERAQLLATLAGQAAVSLETARLYASLQERESRIRRLVDANIIGIRVAQADGRIIDANDAFLDLIGCSRDDLDAGGLNAGALVPPAYDDVVARADAQLRATGRHSPCELEYLRSDGTRVPVLCGGAWLDPALQTSVAFVLDLSERRAAETERAARQAAELANRAKSQFLASMSHELRTPLNAILGYAQLLPMQGGLSERQARALETISRSGEHLLALINDILDLARIEAGRLELVPAPMDMAGFLGSVVDLMQVRADQKQLAFVFDAQTGLPSAVLADERRLRQVLLNLLGNSIKFTDSGTVTLRAWGEQAGPGQVVVWLEIEDTGVGIRPDELPRIFEPFEQVGDVQRRSGGTGLGLAITRALVQDMGGQVHVSSEFGRGTRFRVELPLPVAQPALIARKKVARLLRYLGPQRRVLVVDDVKENRTLLCEFLSNAGFEVAQAEDGSKALTAAREFHPDLILIDSKMPLVDGLEATRRLRQETDFSVVPVIAISASASAEHRDACLKAGVNVFMSKPVRLDELQSHIGEQLGLHWVVDPNDARLADWD